MENQVKSKELQKSIVVEIDKNQYTVKFPTVGQMARIERNKITYSGGMYGELVTMPVKSSLFLLDAVDALSHFLVLCPDIEKDFVNKTINEIEMDKLVEMISVYKKTFHPWYDAWMDKLRTEMDELMKLL